AAYCRYRHLPSFPTRRSSDLAARLEQAAGECEVLLGELTYRLVRDQVEVEPVEPLELKGKAERVPAFRLVAVHDRPAAATERPPLVGRERETEQVSGALGRVIEARVCERVLITGDARSEEHTSELQSRSDLVC